MLRMLLPPLPPAFVLAPPRPCRADPSSRRPCRSQRAALYKAAIPRATR